MILLPGLAAVSFTLLVAQAAEYMMVNIFLVKVFRKRNFVKHFLDWIGKIK